MKIGIVVDNELNNDKRVLREAQILKDNGHKVFALCFAFDSKKYKDIDGIDIRRIDITRRVKNTLFFLFNLIPLYERLWTSLISRFIIDNDLDVIHAHDLYMAKCSSNAIKRSGRSVKLVIDLHENFPFAITTYNWTKGPLRKLISQPGKWSKKEKDYLALADRIIVLSDDFKTEMTTRYPDLTAEKFTVLPNVPDLAEAQPENQVPVDLPFQKTAPVIFYFGVIAERRGVFDAIEVFSELVKENVQAILLLIGPVDKKDKNRFEIAINSELLRGKLIYIPWIDLAQLSAYLKISDICIAPLHKNPQHESGVANKIFDYMLGARPIVASDCRPQQKIINEHYCGIIYSNPSEFQSALSRLLNDEELRIKMGRNGYDAVVNYYSLANTKDNLISLYNSFR